MRQVNRRGHLLCVHLRAATWSLSAAGLRYCACQYDSRTCMHPPAGAPDRQLANAGLVLVLGASDWQRTMLRAELVRLCPQLDPGAKPSRRGGGRGARRPAGDAGAPPSFHKCLTALLGRHVTNLTIIYSGFMQMQKYRHCQSARCIARCCIALRSTQMRVPRQLTAP